MATLPTVIVTGASRGLGAAVARLLASQANVVLNARSVEALNGVAADLRGQGGEALVVAGDVADAAVCQQLVEQTVARFGRIDALVNNAGVLEPIARLAEVDADEWWRNVTVNLFAPFLLTRTALPYLRGSQGRIVNVSSGAAARPVVGWSAYGAAKAALNLLTMTLAREEPRVTAVAVRPGVVDTAMQRQIREEGKEGMEGESYQSFVALYEEGALLRPELPGKALAALALYAPREWSGRFLSWDDEPVTLLAARADGW